MYHIIIIISLSIQHYEAENQKSRRNVCASMQFRHCQQKIEKGKGLRYRVKVTALVESRKGQHASEIRPDRRQQERLQQLGRITCGKISIKGVRERLQLRRESRRHFKM